MAALARRNVVSLLVAVSVAHACDISRESCAPEAGGSLLQRRGQRLEVQEQQEEQVGEMADEESDGVLRQESNEAAEDQSIIVEDHEKELGERVDEKSDKPLLQEPDEATEDESMTAEDAKKHNGDEALFEEEESTEVDDGDEALFEEAEEEEEDEEEVSTEVEEDGDEADSLMLSGEMGKDCPGILPRWARRCGSALHHSITRKMLKKYGLTCLCRMALRMLRSGHVKSRCLKNRLKKYFRLCKKAARVN